MENISSISIFDDIKSIPGRFLDIAFWDSLPLEVERVILIVATGIIVIPFTL